MEPGSPTNSPYRDEKSTHAARLERLRDELAVIQETRQEIEALANREKEIHAEMAQLTAELTKARSKGHLPLLSTAYVALPCKADWNKMVGDERTRFCGMCNKNVYNLSEMSADEAETFLRQLTKDACVRLYRRKDGTVMTNDCPVGQRNNRIKVAAALVVGTGMAAAKILTSVVEPMQVMGGVSMPQMTELKAELSAVESHLDLAVPIMGGMTFPDSAPAKHESKPELRSGPSTLLNPQGIKGKIIAQCSITKEGKTRDCKIVSGPTSMHQPMLDMLAQQLYFPARKYGKAIESKSFMVQVDLDVPPSQTSPARRALEGLVEIPRPLRYFDSQK